MPKKTKAKCKLCDGELLTTDAWTKSTEKTKHQGSTSTCGERTLVYKILVKVFKKECRQCREVTLEIEEWKNK